MRNYNNFIGDKTYLVFEIYMYFLFTIPNFNFNDIS